MSHQSQSPLGDAPSPTPAVISVDVEDWPQSTWDRSLPITARAARNVERLLELLRDLQAKATMFVLGRLADAFPQLVHQMHAEGHEIASHGWGHDEVFRLSPAEFRDDVRRSKERLEDLVGVTVTGYRAPDFSIVDANLAWALETLVDCGFTYDSSIFPIRGRRYGIAGWPTSPVAVQLPSGRSLLEIPVATFECLGRAWPLGGGGYFRLLPGFFARGLAARVLTRRPFVLYCHPYEFDPGEFREIEHEIPWRIRLHQGLGRGRFEQRFRRFVERFGSRTVRELADSGAWPAWALPGASLEESATQGPT